MNSDLQGPGLDATEEGKLTDVLVASWRVMKVEARGSFQESGV